MQRRSSIIRFAGDDETRQKILSSGQLTLVTLEKLTSTEEMDGTREEYVLRFLHF